MNRSFFNLCAASAISCVVLLGAFSAQAAEGIAVETNQARIVKLPQAADTVIVGKIGRAHV